MVASRPHVFDSGSSRTTMIFPILTTALILLLFSIGDQPVEAFVSSRHHYCVVAPSSSSSSSHTQDAAASSLCSPIINNKNPILDSRIVMYSSFYGKFEEFDNDEDDDDDDDDDDDEEDEDDDVKMDERSIADFKSKMSNLFDEGTTTTNSGDGSPGASSTTSTSTVSSVDDLINLARSQAAGADTAATEWAKPNDPGDDEIRPGTVLIANPRRFCEFDNRSGSGGGGGSSSDSTNAPSDGDEDSNKNNEGAFNAANRMFRSVLGGGGDNAGAASSSPSPILLAKFGLTRPPPRSLGADRQADLLPVVVVVETDDRGGVQGVLLNRRTGYLLGDLEQPAPSGVDGGSKEMPPILEKFCIQPLWFGGVDNISTGLDMLHLCPTVQGANKITEDGMFWGGDPAQAQEALDDPSNDRQYSGFDFKFFVQSTIWSKDDLRKEVDNEVWFRAHVAKDVLFKSRDRMGTKKAKPLWTEIMDLLAKEDDEFGNIMESFYAAGEAGPLDD